jgi:two-component system, cell cycle sensor histidine kinase and response regulator CckA
VHGIVRQAGGHLAIQSQAGAGTSVDVYLPRVPRPAEETPARADAPNPRGDGESILLVEDSEALRAWLQRTLAEHGYRVFAAADAVRALALLEAAIPTPHLPLTDVILPGISGRELATRVRERHAPVRVAYMSGYDDEVLMRHGVLDAGICFLPKPFLEADLLRFVRQALEAVALS